MRVCMQWVGLLRRASAANLACGPSRLDDGRPEHSFRAPKSNLDRGPLRQGHEDFVPHAGGSCRSPVNLGRSALRIKRPTFPRDGLLDCPDFRQDNPNCGGLYGCRAGLTPPPSSAELTSGGIHRGLTVTFGFELRFLTPAGRTIKGVDIDKDFPLEFAGVIQRVSLRQLPRRPNDAPSSPERFLMKGSGFPTEAAARSFGERLKLALAVIGCEASIGIDVGRDLATSGAAAFIKDAIREQQGLQLRDIYHGLDVFPEDPPVIHIELSATATSAFALEGFPGKVANEVTTIKPLSPKQSLALELYNLGHFEPATKARFLNLVSIIEILKTCEPKAKGVRDQIDVLMRSVKASGLSDEEKNSLISGLGSLKRESISAACRRIVAESLGEEAAQYFSECYKARSELLHSGETERPQINNWGRLDEIVRQVLLTMVRAT